VDSPGLDAALLLAQVLGTGRAGLIVRGGEVLEERAWDQYRGLLDRRRGGECTAYILGRKEFWGLDFMVSPDALVPRPDTETLVEAALERIDRKAQARLKILDLCTGSGAVAAALKHERPFLDIWASDISPKALALARANAERLFAGSGAINFVESDLFAALRGAIFDMIVSNPPYVPGPEIEKLSPEVRREPRLALDGGPGGLEIIRRIVAAAPARLVPGGVLLMEGDGGQMGAIAGMLEENGFTGIKRRRDLSGVFRVIGGTYG
jgi:release factor glutamine methyltransferase